MSLRERLKRNRIKLSDNYGDLNKVLAAEWAKFRWGVFDDSPPPNAGRDFYATQSFVEASKCSLEIKSSFKVYPWNCLNAFIITNFETKQREYRNFEKMLGHRKKGIAVLPSKN